jgi:nucleotide-binding universal stress UspA family protein
MDRIVVGLDGSDPAQRALRWALDLSDSLGGVPILAVHVCADAEAAYEKGFCNRAQADEWLAESRREAQGILREALADAGRDEAELPVSLETIPGRPAAALVDAVTSEDLLVVGPRGVGRFRGLLGSVSQTCVTNAPCPVVVVRGDADARMRPEE